ncbi:DUF4350 domain-containing protein [Neobacillus pocheonensis]|uniref:DUF4350 domain-containing protein n=1 Tax=Neobacillus pocheonensis TaxID=363869 RepID=UPI003D29F5D4
MKKSQFSRQTWLWLSVILLLFILISYITFTPKPQVYPNYVANSPSPTGIKAINTYLKNEKDAINWVKPPGFLPKIAGNKLLIIVEPDYIPEKEEMKEYSDFMKAGNTVLLFMKNPKGMFDISIGPKENAPSNREMKVFNQNNKAFNAAISSDVRLNPKNGNEVLLHDDAGAVALKQTYGKGHLIVALAPEWLTNGKLLKNDHLPLIVNLINIENPRTILFNEYVHGEQTDIGFLTAFPKWFLLLLLQGLLLTILWLWFKGKRFGPIFLPREETVRFSDEGIRALTAWYLKGRRYHDSLLIQADYVKLLLQERWGIPYNRQWLDLPNYLERKWQQIPNSEIRPFIHGLTNVLEKGKLNKQEYLLWSKKLDQLRKEVETG